VNRLVADLTPRTRASLDGSGWAPPTRSEGAVVVYEKPGALWAAAARRKLVLLTSLRNQLKNAGLCGQPMTFVTLMAFVQPDESDLDFDSRVFLYLVALMLNQKRFVIFSFPVCFLVLHRVLSQPLSVLLMTLCQFCWLSYTRD